MQPCQPRTLTDSSLKWHALVKILDPISYTDIKNDRGDLGGDLAVVIRMLDVPLAFFLVLISTLQRVEERGLCLVCKHPDSLLLPLSRLQLPGDGLPGSPRLASGYPVLAAARFSISSLPGTQC